MNQGWSSAIDDFSLFQDEEFNTAVPPCSDSRGANKRLAANVPWKAARKYVFDKQQSADAQHSAFHRQSEISKWMRDSAMTTYAPTSNQAPQKDSSRTAHNDDYQSNSRSNDDIATTGSERGFALQNNSNDLDEDLRSVHWSSFDAASLKTIRRRNLAANVDAPAEEPKRTLDHSGENVERDLTNCAGMLSPIAKCHSSAHNKSPMDELSRRNGAACAKRNIHFREVPYRSVSPMMLSAPCEKPFAHRSTSNASNSNMLTSDDESYARRRGFPCLAHVSLKKNKWDAQTRLDLIPMPYAAISKVYSSEGAFQANHGRLGMYEHRQEIDSSSDRQSDFLDSFSGPKPLWDDGSSEFVRHSHALIFDQQESQERLSRPISKSSQNREGRGDSNDIDRRERLYGATFSVDEEEEHRRMKEKLKKFQASSSHLPWTTLPSSRRPNISRSTKKMKQDRTDRPRVGSNALHSDLPATPSLGAASKFPGASLCNIRLGGVKKASTKRRKDGSDHAAFDRANQAAPRETEHVKSKGKVAWSSSDAGFVTSIDPDSSGEIRTWADADYILISDDSSS